MIKYIVVLDDDIDESYILEEAFAELNISVHITQVQTFAELLDFLEKALLVPDLLFLDINLPTQTGLECLKILKAHERYQHLPIVMYSNASHEPTIEECFICGANVYMQKNGSFETLKLNLSRLMSWTLHNVFHLPITERTFLN
jgi:CheY-like chemotaxis protein